MSEKMPEWLHWKMLECIDKAYGEDQGWCDSETVVYRTGFYECYKLLHKRLKAAEKLKEAVENAASKRATDILLDHGVDVGTFLNDEIWKALAEYEEAVK